MIGAWMPDPTAAVAATGVDSGAVAHFGAPMVEQRLLAAGSGWVRLRHWDVIRVTGPDRLTWLHALTTQFLSDLAPGTWSEALILSPRGHVEHHLRVIDDGTSALLVTEPGCGAALVAYLRRMIFWTAVEVAVVEHTLWWDLAGFHVEAAPQGASERPEVGVLAFHALRIAAGSLFLPWDIDHRTIPNETTWLETAVHLRKGCYRGQETVAKVNNLGRPPRLQALLHLDGSQDRLPAVGAAVVTDSGRSVGRAGSSALHWELGMIGTGLLKHSTEAGTKVDVDGVAATVEFVVRR